MKRILNIDNMPREHIDDPDFQSKMQTLLIGNALGCEKIYVNIDYVKPGGKSVKYHSHSKQEEFFLIMQGSGLLRMNGEEVSIKTGDVISKPAGQEIAHQFINNGSEILQILDAGTREKDDIATYPDENVVFIRNKGLVFDIKDCMKGWTSDPNS
ncbi:Cupin 2 conserved barrel domain protein [Desulfitobacterium hafniense DCB-2]|uniref:Cupin 2 conserved barrel domain protein n=1 Tax=Desulfitobacterium hafniense (strain DSM 10664 / DCB-2) TaxID=272564 RepID=B8FPG5_DESHD|nr:cupin domain-containing protein [Desulfitobacterium hafniense]ACL19690.1 Cupin 2 conserved barrel domain protein [Desulfitobacterium hafniense DCB-2]